MIEYAKEYIEGDKMYQEENYSETIEHLERSLKLYWEALEECRLGCENPFDQGWFPDFVSSISNHFTFTLRCKLKCPSKLSNLYGEEIKDFVASIFNYLQFSYYKVGNLPKGCEAVESYLILDPGNPSQMRNRQFFWTQEGVKEEFFKPRQKVLDHQERLAAEAKLMKFIEENFSHLLTDDLEEKVPKTAQEFPEQTETLPSISETLLEIAQLLGQDGGNSDHIDSNLGSDVTYKEEL